MKRLKLLVFLLFLCLAAKAQPGLRLHVKPMDSTEAGTVNALLKKTGHKTLFPDTLSLKREKESLLLKLYDLGYLAASFDSVARDPGGYTLFLSLGGIYKWMRLDKGNVDEGILSEAGFRERLYNQKPIHFRNVRKLQERILDYCENNGYPFAEVAFDSIVLNGRDIAARLRLQKNNKIITDSIVIKGTAKISRIYLYNYLGIKQGRLYNESQIRQISTRIKELPFLQEVKPFEIGFSETKANIFLYLDNRKASQFDFIAGFLPDSRTPSKLIFTGEAHLKLQNSFGRGEVFELNWKSPMPLTQDLKINVVYPFVFSSPFGIDANFSLYKRDTTYIDIIRNLGVQYILTRGNYFKVFVVDKQSSLINTRKYINATQLPDNLDVSSLSYGLAYKMENLDYRFNPRSGYSLLVSGTIGTRTIKKNRQIREELYNGLRLSTTIYTADYIADYYIPLRARNVINFGVKGAMLMSPNILSNELFRIGGLRTLRGFDEESILASFYTVLKTEYRFILEQNSYLFAFYDRAFYENKAAGRYVKDTPYGFGAGITFETKLGIFSFTYALGKQFENPLYLRSGKIHFGIISYF